LSGSSQPKLVALTKEGNKKKSVALAPGVEHSNGNEISSHDESFHFALINESSSFWLCTIPFAFIAMLTWDSALIGP